jgi:hypothetical protein
MYTLSDALELPNWLDEISIVSLWENMYRASVWLFLSTRDKIDGHGNFLVLHLMTSLWGLEQVCQVLEDENTQRALS